MFRNVAELVYMAESENKKISDVMIEQEMNITERSYEQIIAEMNRNLDVMEKAVDRGIKGVQSHSGLTGGDAALMQKYIEKGKRKVGA